MEIAVDVHLSKTATLTTPLKLFFYLFNHLKKASTAVPVSANSTTATIQNTRKLSIQLFF